MDHCWFSGPTFLYESKDAWPQRKHFKQEEPSEDCLTEIAKWKMTFLTDFSLPWMDSLRYSS